MTRISDLGAFGRIVGFARSALEDSLKRVNWNARKASGKMFDPTMYDPQAVKRMLIAFPIVIGWIVIIALLASRERRA